MELAASRRSTLLGFCAVLAVATFLRVWQLPTIPPGLYPDEGMNGSNALEALRTHHFQLFYPENNGREGLFINAQALCVAAFGREPWILRIPAAFFGTLTVAGLFFFARELFRSDRVGLLSAFLLATNFWHINFSRIGLRTISASFFVVWALYFFLLSMRTRRPIHAVIAGVFFGLGFYSYIAYRVMPLLAVAFAPFCWRDKAFRRAAVICIATTFIVALPLGLYFLQHPTLFWGRTHQISVTSGPSPWREFGSNVAQLIGMLFIDGDRAWRHNYADRPELFWPVGILFLAGALVRPIVLWRRKEADAKTQWFRYTLLYVWFFLAILPVALSDQGIPNALRSVLMVCPVFALAGIGGIWLYDEFLAARPPLARRLITALFCIALVAEAYHTYFMMWAPHPDVTSGFTVNYVQLGRNLNREPPNVAKYVVVQAEGYDVVQRDPWTGRLHAVPVPAQTVMFVTDSFSPERQRERNIHYVVKDDKVDIPECAPTFYVR